MAQSTTEFVERTDADQAPPGPARISGGHLVAKALKAEGVDTIFTLCGGFSGGVVQPKSPGHWMDPGPLGTLGGGMPSSMAAKLARPKKEVVTLFGDGAFSLTGWDFETMVRFNLPFVGAVGNNSLMNQIRYGQAAKYGSDVAASETPSAMFLTTSSPRCSAATGKRSATPRTSHPRYSGPASRGCPR